MATRRASSLAGDVGAQIADLKDTIADLGAQIADITAARAKDAPKSARSAARSVRSTGSSVYDDGLEALHSAGDTAVYYGRRAGNVVKQNPGISVLGLAVGIGVIAAIVFAAQEEDRRWYQRGGGWF